MIYDVSFYALCIGFQKWSPVHKQHTQTLFHNACICFNILLGQLKYFVYMSHFTGGWLSWWCWFKSLTVPNTWLQFSTPHLKDLTGRTLLGKVKLFVIKVPFFSLFTGAVSELVAWLSVDSVVSLFVTNSPSVGSACGIGAGAGVGARGFYLVWYFIQS